MGTYTVTVENDEEVYTAEFSIDDEDGIQPLPLTPSPVSKGEAGAVYDLSGRRVTSMLPKGIYIRDGRKIVIQ